MPALPARSALALSLLVLALAGCLGDEGQKSVQCPSVPPEAGTVLHGEVYRDDGRSGRGSYIEARGPSGQVLHTATQQGTPCFALLVNPGAWTVVASQDGWAGSSSATLADAEHRGVVILMQRVEGAGNATDGR